MVSEPELLPGRRAPRWPYRLPRDPVGTRPREEVPRGPVRLLWTVLVALRFHFWRVLRLVVLAVVILVVLIMLVAFAAVKAGHGEKDEVAYLVHLVALLSVPLFAGLSLVLLLLIQGYPASWREVFRPFQGLRLYGHVLAAGVPAVALGAAASLGLKAAGVETHLAEMLGEGPWAAWGAGLPVLLAASLVNVPFQFAALDAVTTGSPFWRSLARNLRFAGRDPGLLVTYGLFVFAFSAVFRLGTTFGRTAERPESALWLAAWLFGGLAVGLMGIAAMAVLHPAYYREFVWRERERHAPVGTTA